jgi:hypothetical protein
MPYKFTEWEQVPEAQPSSGHSTIPPWKFTGVGVLDPPGPPKKPVGPIPGIPPALLLRILAGLILLAAVSAIVVALFASLAK